MSRFFLGIDHTHVRDLEMELEKAMDLKFDFMTVSLMHPRFRRDNIGVSKSRTGPMTRSDLVLDSRRWSTCIIGKLSPWLNLDSVHDDVRMASEASFIQEIGKFA
jgi:protein arginine N-methyltransferase 5